jgi:hypothetical protein
VTLTADRRVEREVDRQFGHRRDGQKLIRVTFEIVWLGKGVEASAVGRVLDDRLTFERASFGQPLESRHFVVVDLDLVFVTQSQQSVHDLPRRVYVGSQVAPRTDRNRVVDQLRQIFSLDFAQRRGGLFDDFRLRRRKHRSGRVGWLGCVGRSRSERSNNRT